MYLMVRNVDLKDCQGTYARFHDTYPPDSGNTVEDSGHEADFPKQSNYCCSDVKQKSQKAVIQHLGMLNNSLKESRIKAVKELCMLVRLLLWQVLAVGAIFVWGINSEELLQSLSIALEYMKSWHEPTPAVRELKNFGIEWDSVLSLILNDLLRASLLVAVNVLNSFFAFRILIKRDHDLNSIYQILYSLIIAVGLVAPGFLVYKASFQ